MGISSSGSMFYTPKCDDSDIPIVGMCFSSVDEGVMFYKKYARISGFHARCRGDKRCAGGLIKYKYVYCNRQGKHTKDLIDTLDNSNGKFKYRRTNTNRCECQAMVAIKLAAVGVYKYFRFVADHNYSLADVKCTQFLKSNRSLCFAYQSFIRQCSNLNIGSTLAHGLSKELPGGFSNVGAQKTDYKNFNRDVRAYIRSVDARMVVNKLLHKLEFCGGHAFDYYVEDGCLLRMFWADLTARKNYAAFGDVVSFESCMLLGRTIHLQQQAKIHWAKHGDLNSSYFHAALKKRCFTNKICRLKDQAGN
uniref:FAR1 domain-containing protein n=1 Tax=Kalanchoe fedtschenkoi TaxID=63787 RepID=A0A7N0TEG1_KALFE